MVKDWGFCLGCSGTVKRDHFQQASSVLSMIPPLYDYFTYFEFVFNFVVFMFWVEINEMKWNETCKKNKPFWFSMEHCWIVTMPFWLSTDDTMFANQKMGLNQVFYAHHWTLSNVSKPYQNVQRPAIRVLQVLQAELRPKLGRLDSFNK